MSDPVRKPASAWFFSDAGSTLLKTVECLSLTPYDDQVGRGQVITNWVPGATIGYGHLIPQSQWATYCHTISQDDAQTLFEHDAAPMVTAVRNAISAELTQNQFDALVILTFNIGAGNFATSSVVKLINNPAAPSAYTSLQSAWMAWDRSQGKEMQGLVKRRTCEWNIYSDAVYEAW